MRLAKVAAASVSPTVGAVTSNVSRLITIAKEMADADVTIAGFPEQVIGGYPPEDLVQWRGFLDGQRRELERFARETAESPTVYVLGLAVAVGGQLFNSAAILHRGRVLGLVPKEKLPTYNVFYEARTFSHGGAKLALDAAGVPLGDYIFRFDFGLVAIEVCEDAWSPDGPMRRRCYSGAELVVNVSSSPFRAGVGATRREMLATRSSDNQTVLIYANAVGGQDGLIFDGGALVFQNGRLVLDAPSFREGWAAAVVDLDRTSRLRMENTTWRTDCEAFRLQRLDVPVIACPGATADRSRLSYPAPDGGSFFLPASQVVHVDPRDAALDDLFEALAVGVRSYFEKTGAFTSLGIALSGGRDSMLTLLVAWRAAQLIVEAGRAGGAGKAGKAGGPGRDGGPAQPHPAYPPYPPYAPYAPYPPHPPAGALITAFYMPSRHSLATTRTAAHTLADELGVELRTVPIDEAIDREIAATREMLEGDEITEVTRQNIQARIRGQRMWNWANSSGALFLQTGDMSEKAVGYTTIGGDLEGALSVIANVPKTVVNALLERLHRRFGFQGIAATLATMPGPELADAQSAESELMPFPIIDACLHLYAAEKMSPGEVEQALVSLFPNASRMQAREWASRFARMFTQSIYKWVQSPLSLHVGSLDLERERALQMPVVQKTEWTTTDDTAVPGPPGASAQHGEKYPGLTGARAKAGVSGHSDEKK
ncbi:MAG TPA: NAD(+) synthase [Vicinamibacterales bacterium]|nr:NAD(+) synthase [Vicinamibacterales bacterium]